MLTELAQARDLGYALDDGEQELGVRCVAVPLTGLPFLSAISVQVPAAGSPWMMCPRIAQQLQTVAAETSRSFEPAENGRPLRHVNLEDVS